MLLRTENACSNKISVSVFLIKNVGEAFVILLKSLFNISVHCHSFSCVASNRCVLIQKFIDFGYSVLLSVTLSICLHLCLGWKSYLRCLVLVSKLRWVHLCCHCRQMMEGNSFVGRRKLNLLISIQRQVSKTLSVSVSSGAVPVIFPSQLRDAEQFSNFLPYLLENGSFELFFF